MSARSYVPPVAHQAPLPGSVELAYRPINITNQEDREYLRATAGDITGITDEAWKNYRRIGEIRYAVSRSAKIAGYWVPRAVRVNSAGKIIDEKESGVVADIVNSMYSPFGGTRGLAERFYTLRKVVGDSFLIGVRHNGADLQRDGYWFMSPSEIQKDSVTVDQSLNLPVTWITSRSKGADGSQKAFRRSVLAKDFLGRVWAPDAQFLDDADSPMQSIAGMCEMLNELTDNIMGRLKQRFALAGILLIPTEISDAAISGEGPNTGKYSSDKVLNYLIHIMTQNVMHHSSASGQIPALLKGPADVLDKVRHLILDSQVHETDLMLRGELINRILDSLDQQKQQVTGESQDHFSAWRSGDEERRITVQPDIESMCHALTRMVLWKILKEERKWEDAKILPWRVWYDLSAASVKSNQGEDARQAWDRGAVNGDFLRSASGANPTDAMSPEETVRWAGWRSQNPILMTYGLKGINVDWDRAAAWGKTPGPNPDSGGDAPKAGPGAGDPGSPDSDDSDTKKTDKPG